MDYLQQQLQTFYNRLPDYAKRDFDVLDESGQFAFMERSERAQRDHDMHRTCQKPQIKPSGMALIAIAKSTRDSSAAREIYDEAHIICESEKRISILPRHVYQAISIVAKRRNEKVQVGGAI